MPVLEKIQMLDEKRDSVLYRLTNYFESEFRPAALIVMIFAGILGNCASWLISLFAPETLAEILSGVIDLESKFLFYLLAFPFFFAFITAFAACKFIFRRRDRDLVSEDEFLSGYSGHLKQENIRRIMFISLSFGGLNSILLSLAVIWFR